MSHFKARCLQQYLLARSKNKKTPEPNPQAQHPQVKCQQLSLLNFSHMSTVITHNFSSTYFCTERKRFSYYFRYNTMNVCRNKSAITEHFLFCNTKNLILSKKEISTSSHLYLLDATYLCEHGR